VKYKIFLLKQFPRLALNFMMNIQLSIGIFLLSLLVGSKAVDKVKEKSPLEREGQNERAWPMLHSQVRSQCREQIFQKE
jgi:hypothetical protein